MSRRTDQISSTLQRAVQEVLARGLHDPRVTGLTTITGVTVSPDLKTAVVLVSVLPDTKQALTLHGLEDAAGHIRHQVARSVRMRRVPEFKFKADLAAKEQAAVLAAIAKARSEYHDPPDDDQQPAPDSHEGGW
ncbi:MAG: 30S ribosome-binding factor RbfA [Planctomycetes bacterium]|nr:30S ribosome-binding factor RbfA [Planctomycetota bacterium]